MDAGVGRRPDTRSREELCRDPCAHRSHRSGGWARQPHRPHRRHLHLRSDCTGLGAGLERVSPGVERHPGHVRACGRREWRPRGRAPRRRPPQLSVEPARRRAEHLGRLRRHAPHRLSRRPLRRPGEGGQWPRTRQGRHAEAGERSNRLHRRAGPDRPRGQHLRRRRHLGVVPAGHRLAGLRRLDEGDRRLRRHGRQGRDGAVHRAGFDVLRSGATETTDAGDVVTLAADPDARLDRAGLEAAGALEPGWTRSSAPPRSSARLSRRSTCRPTQPDPKAYVNYDLADRENDVSIDYLVVHDTECDYADCVRYTQTPNRFVSWQYTSGPPTDTWPSTSKTTTSPPTRATGTSTCTRSGSSTRGTPGGRASGTPTRSTALRRARKYLAAKYGFELDRAHVVGHEEFWSANYKWDPGPYWDWERYMKLLGAPIAAEGVPRAGSSPSNPAPPTTRTLWSARSTQGPHEYPRGLPAGRHELRLPPRGTQ